MWWVLVSTSAALLVVSLAALLSLPGTRRHVIWLLMGAAVGAGALSVTVGPHSWTTSLAWGAFAGFSATLVAIDLATRTLPREISLLGFVLVAGFLLFSPAPSSGGVLTMLVGAVMMTAITALLVFISRGALGVGDLFLSPMLGAALGWIDPWLVVVAWLVTAVTGGVVIAGLIVSRRVSARSKVPYGPFMVAGTFAVLALGGWRI